MKRNVEFANQRFGWDEGLELIPKNTIIAKSVPAGQKQIGAAVDTALMRGLVEAETIAFATQWWQQLETATKDKLAIMLRTHISEGLVMEELIADIEPIFGAKRAEAIAVTEVTRLFTMGALLAYQASDVRMVVWRTCNDPWVCSSCGSFEGEKYDIGKHPEQPAHCRCRCWLSPWIGEEIGQKFNPYHDAEGRFASGGGTGLSDLPSKYGIKGTFQKAEPYLREGDVKGVELLDHNKFSAQPGVNPHDVAFYNSQTHVITLNEMALAMDSNPRARISHEIGHAVGDRIAKKNESGLVGFWDRHSSFLSGNQKTDPSEGFAELFAIRLTDPGRFKRAGRPNGPKELDQLLEIS